MNPTVLDPLAYSVNDVNIPRWILTILATIVIIIFWWSIYSLIRAIIGLIFSDWSQQEKDKAWRAVWYMLMWIIFTIIFLYIFPVIFQQLKVQWYQYYTAKNVFRRSWEIVRDIANVKWIIQGWYQWSDIFKDSATQPGLQQIQYNNEL